MKNLVIIDDEKIILNGLERYIAQSKLNFTVVDTATNGVEGLQAIMKHNPDIVLMDIVMPEMNGIEVGEKVRELGYVGDIVFLSAHADFSYAKEAIKIGAVRYLLKPIDHEELRSLLNELVDNTTKAVQKEVLEPKLLELIYENNKVYPFKFAQIVTLKIEGMNNKLLRFNIESKLELEKRHHIGISVENIGNYINLFFYTSSLCKSIFQKRVYEIIGQIYNHYEKGRWGIGSIIELGDEIQEKYNESIKAWEKTFFLEEDRKICYYQTTQCEEIYDYSFKAICRAIDIQDTQQIGEIIRDMVKQFKSKGNISEVKGVIKKWLQIIDEKEVLKNRRYLEELNSKLIGVKEFGEIKELMYEVEGELLYWVGLEKRTGNTIVTKTIQYIHQNYADKDLNLNRIAEKLGVSPYYLSKLYKDVTKVNFVKSLNNLKIEQAMKLLKRTNKSIAEIGEECGFNDQRYFAKVFKKYTNYTPKEYRKEYLF